MHLANFSREGQHVAFPMSGLDAPAPELAMFCVCNMSDLYRQRVCLFSFVLAFANLLVGVGCHMMLLLLCRGECR